MAVVRLAYAFFVGDQRMKNYLSIVLLLGIASFAHAQNPALGSESSQAQNGSHQQIIDDVRHWNVADENNLQGQIMMSLEDHNLSNLRVQVTEKAIDISGTVSSKAEKQLAHDLVTAYLLDQKLHDHIKIRRG
jgi:hypothetical protein